MMFVFWLFHFQDKKKRDKENASNEDGDDANAKGDVEWVLS